MIGVVDTSAFVRLFLPDGPIPHGLTEFMRGVERGEDLAIAPELMLAEATNVAVRKHRQGLLSLAETGELTSLMVRMPVRYMAHRPLTGAAVDLALTHGLTVYDALFLALARAKAARLFTADGELARAAAADF